MFAEKIYHVILPSTLVDSTTFSHIDVSKQQNQMLLLIFHVTFLQQIKPTNYETLNK
jgi:hypothetical protein